MAIKFCKKCGKVLKTVKEKDRIFLRCTCGFSEEISENHLITHEKIKKKRREVALIEDENPAATFPP